MALADISPFFGDTLTLDLIDQLEHRGWAHAGDALDPALVAGLRAEARAMAEAGELKTARIGRGEALAKDTGYRKTQIAWLDGTSPAQRAFLGGAEALRVAVNRALFAGLFEFEAHFAAYPPGGFYKRHLDAFTAPALGASPAAILGRRAERSRVVSLVAYLNEAWQPGDGGELAVWEETPYGPDARPDMAALDAVSPAGIVEPRGGSLVLMMSETIPHEVRPARTPRYAIAGWFRVNQSLGGLVDPGR